MHDALLIARREYLERVRSRTFVVTTLILPVVMALLMGGGILASPKGTEIGAPDSALSNLAAAYVMISLLYFSVMYYGMNVARSVIEEKTSRVFEVLLAATTPESLMAGKLLGVGSAGLTQIGIWICLAVFAAAAWGGGIFASLGISTLRIVFFVLFYLLGFLFYSALSAAFGASAGSEQEIQQFGFIIALPMIASLVLMAYILRDPDAPAVVALSLFPPCTPVVMYLRMAAHMPPMWQLALSVALMAAAIWAMLRIAARIYRVGILMQGKRATLGEMLRWLRSS